jgi:hypothetical protein
MICDKYSEFQLMYPKYYLVEMLTTVKATETTSWSSAYVTSDLTGTSQETSVTTDHVTTSTHRQSSISSTTFKTQDLNQYAMKGLLPSK